MEPSLDNISVCILTEVSRYLIKNVVGVRCRHQKFKSFVGDIVCVSCVLSYQNEKYFSSQKNATYV